MYSIAQENIRDRVKGMSREELEFAVQFVPKSVLDNELSRRTSIAERKMMAVDRLVCWMSQQPQTLDNMTMFLKGIREVV